MSTMIKRRTRPQTSARQKSPETDATPLVEGQDGVAEEEEPNLPIAELIEWRKLRRTRQGIDVAKLNVGDAKKMKKKRAREEDQGGLQKKPAHHEDDVEDEEMKDARARRVVRANNFTQQTNTLDVDKHMMAYIEENLKVRSKPKDDDEDDDDKKPLDPNDALYQQVVERYKQLERARAEEGNVTNSMSMLTAIPEVDLGMDTRLKNIEDTEKAKRVVAEERHERKKLSPDEEHLVATTRFYRPNLRAKSDADILRDAKLEAMGLPPQDDSPRRSNHDRVQTATDEMVMERFKKRMRK
ncbi:hepatocellular carcinoma-associated antigen 59-domain-containing protein [Coprinopsis sp. MPI-PUGE-AT-0042]|nr:hepatocellular carcinoma-associated antigen 59-domain-containing protein [Coprinopsis sp. MPI-PUGE-AT-0042]